MGDEPKAEAWDGQERRATSEDTPRPGERARLQETAQVLGHWQGMIEGEVAESKHRLDKINGSLAKVAENLSGLLVEVATFRRDTSTAQQAKDKRKATGVGAVSAVVVGVVVFLITKLLGG